MKRSGMIKTQLEEINTIQSLTSALEGVSSIRVSQIKDKVVPGRQCFDELWLTYSELRIDADRHKRFISTEQHRFSNNKTLYLIIASEGSLSGSIDQRIVDYFMTARESADADVIALGSRGATLLEQRGIKTLKTFPLPDHIDQNFLSQVGQAIEQYAKITIYYQSYVSLNQQVVRTIDLISAVATLGSETSTGNEIISSRDYFFEPSLKEIIKIMESTMLQIALREVILDSYLAQQASRFSAMLLAEVRAKKQRRSLSNSLHKARRDESDVALRESAVQGGSI
jgi:ATP synthase F1 gamma subunit